MQSSNNEKLSKTSGAIDASGGSHFDVIALAASADGIKAITEIISSLPADFPASILVVQHMSPHVESNLARILSQHTSLKVKEAEDGERFTRGTIYTARRDKHLMVNPDGTLSLATLDKVQFTRPAADVLFVTMATSYKDRAIAVILTGAGQDGAIGSLVIKRLGGKVIVQEDPNVPSMPEAAIRIDDVDFIKPLAEIAPIITNLVTKGESPDHAHPSMNVILKPVENV
ncbi:MAG: chemotaxis protein CheB [Methanotrichaceae archaeon]